MTLDQKPTIASCTIVVRNSSVYFFPRETQKHPWKNGPRKSSRVKFRFTGVFWRNFHGCLEFFTGEIFKNLHGHFSRATENFRKSSRVGAKISRVTFGRNFSSRGKNTLLGRVFEKIVSNLSILEGVFEAKFQCWFFLVRKCFGFPI